MLIIGSISIFYKSKQKIINFEETAQAETELNEVVPIEQRYPYVIEPRATFSESLRKLDISPRDIHDIVVAAKPIKDLGRLHPGIRFQILHAPNEIGNLVSIRIKLSPQEVLLVQKELNTWVAEKITKQIQTKVATFRGLVKSSLWESALEAGMNPTIIAELAEIFAWQVDFSREVQVGDRWRLSVEEEFVKGESIGWGSILSAEYINGANTYTAILFRKEKEDMGYFAPDGTSLKRVFLKSPIQYGRISSRFSKRRFHPVLKVARPHNGVDYAAPTGTPIRAVGDGMIAFVGRSGGGGNVITVRHNSTYTTSYKHLSRFAKGLRKGSSVQQGQTIGYVGATGLASGPHLHFEFFVNGRYVDPLSQKFPTAEPIPPDKLVNFLEMKDKFFAYLPDWI